MPSKKRGEWVHQITMLNLVVLTVRHKSYPQSRQSTKLSLRSSELELPHRQERWGGAHALAGEGAGAGGANSNEGTDTVVLQVYIYFVV